MNDIPSILIIDDDYAVRKTLGDILRIKGFKVALAECGAAAIAELQHSSIDVALIDLNLPDMNGIVVMERLKAIDSLVQAIILTGHAAIETAIEATNKGAFSYLLKPYDIENLLFHIRHAVDQRRAMEEIRRLASFPQLNPDPIIEFNRAGEITYVNPAAKTLFPEISEQGLNHPVLSGLGENLTTLLQGESHVCIREVLLGDEVYEERISYIPEGEFVRLYALNVTQRKRAVDALGESEQRYKAIIENAQDGILLTDTERRKFQSANPKICEMLGYSMDELLRMGVADIHPEGFLPSVVDQFERQAKGEIALAKETPVKRKDGSVFYADINAFPVMLQGKPYLAGFFRDVTERRAQEARLHELIHLLRTIHDINEHLLIVNDEKDIFDYVSQALSGIGHVIVVVIGLKMPDFSIKLVSWAGIDASDVAELALGWDDAVRGKGVLGSAIRMEEPCIVLDIERNPSFDPWRDIVNKSRLRSGVGIPLVADGSVIGVLGVYSDNSSGFNDEVLRFLNEVADDVALGVRTLRMSQRLESSLQSIRKSLDGTVMAIANIVEMRDPYTAGHERNVAQLSCAIAAEMGLSEYQIEGLRVIGYLHDIGKISVPAEILSKPSLLTELEHEILKVHVQAGYDILKDLDFPWPVAQAVLQHHERMNGSGYPNGLKEKDIIIEAKILMVADVMEAMLGHRPYRPALGQEVALNEILTNKGRLYDSVAADACVRLFVEKGFKFTAA